MSPASPGICKAIEKLGKTPLLALGMRLGEGTGAALAAGIVKAAAACHSGMATFAQAPVSPTSIECIAMSGLRDRCLRRRIPARFGYFAFV